MIGLEIELHGRNLPGCRQSGNDLRLPVRIREELGGRLAYAGRLVMGLSRLDSNQAPGWEPGARRSEFMRFELLDKCPHAERSIGHP
jgi:hypothetical protein